MPQDVPKNFSKDNEWTTTKWNYRSLFHLYEASVERFPTLEIYTSALYTYTYCLYTHSYCFISESFYVMLCTSKLVKEEKAGNITCYP